MLTSVDFEKKAMTEEEVVKLWEAFKVVDNSRIQDTRHVIHPWRIKNLYPMKPAT